MSAIGFGLLVGALSSELPTNVSVQVRGELASEEVEVLRLTDGGQRSARWWCCSSGTGWWRGE